MLSIAKGPGSGYPSYGESVLHSVDGRRLPRLYRSILRQAGVLRDFTGYTQAVLLGSCFICFDPIHTVRFMYPYSHNPNLPSALYNSRVLSASEPQCLFVFHPVLCPCQCPCPIERSKSKLRQPNVKTPRVSPVGLVAHHAVNAKLRPRIPIPMNAKATQRFRLCVKERLSENSCNATLVITPAVTANMHPYTLLPGAISPLPAT